MTLRYRQGDNGNQPPQGGGDTGAGNGGGDATPTDGGVASLPFEDPGTVSTTATTASSVTRTTPIIPPTNNAAGGTPVGSGVAQDPAGFATQLSGTLTVSVPSGLTVADASATSNPSSAPVTALGLSLPVLIGIIAGVFAFLVIVLIVVIVLYRRAGRKRRAQNSLHSHDAEGSPYAGGGGRGSRNRSKADELTPPPTPAPLSHKALMQEKQRDMAALDALVSALDKAEARSGSQRYDPSRSGPGAGSVAKLKAATAAGGGAPRQSDFIEWEDEEEEGSEFDTKRQKRRTVDMLPDADVFRAAIAPKS